MRARARTAKSLPAEKPPGPASASSALNSAADAHTVFALADGLRVGLSPEEPAGRICTRNAGVLEFEASLQWPPESEAAQLFAGGISSGESVRASFHETTTGGCNRIRGSIVSPYEEQLRAALDRILRDLARAAVYEAALTSRVLRSRRPFCASSSAVESLARELWEAGLRVEFGTSYSPAPEGAEVTVGCRGAEERLAAVLSGCVERRGVAG